MALDFPKPPLLYLDHYLISGRAMQNAAWQRIHQSVAASATSHEITRSKHEHELHTTPCKLLKCCPNRPHPSSAQKRGSLPEWLRSGAFSDLLGCTCTWSGPVMPTIRTHFRVRYPTPYSERRSAVYGTVSSPSWARHRCIVPSAPQKKAADIGARAAGCSIAAK